MEVEGFGEVRRRVFGLETERLVDGDVVVWMAQLAKSADEKEKEQKKGKKGGKLQLDGETKQLGLLDQPR